jgi:hypothetical protein
MKFSVYLYFCLFSCLSDSMDAIPYFRELSLIYLEANFI